LTAEELKQLQDLIRFEGPPPKYDLLAVVDHIGSARGGHYIAYCKCQDHANPDTRRWYVFDDSSVSPILESKVRTNNAYLLFYVQQGFEGLDFLPSDLKEKMARASPEDVQVKISNHIKSTSRGTSRDCSKCVML